MEFWWGRCKRRPTSEAVTSNTVTSNTVTSNTVTSREVGTDVPEP